MTSLGHICDSALKYAFYAVLVALIALEYDRSFNPSKQKHPDAGLSLEALVTKYGYPIEFHEVITEDDYIITLQRIPHGKNGKGKNKGIPVLLAHCLACSAYDYVSIGPGNALAFQLADRGYDVWLMNARGNTFSRKHTRLNPDKDSEYWNFSWHEIGLYDLPETIDYVLQVTEQPRLHYIGLSQGSTILFLLLAEKPEYNKKIRLMTSLAPAVYFDTPNSLAIRALARIDGILTFQRKYLNKQEYLSTAGLGYFTRVFCHKGSIFLKFCIFVNSILCGFNEKGVNLERLEVIHSYRPGGCSSKQLEHFFQCIKSGNFAEIDYGPGENLKFYNQETPPNYDLSKVTAPVAVYYSVGDAIVNEKAAKRLIKELPNVVKDYQVPDEEFSHTDFLYDVNINELVYHSIFEEMERH